MELDLNSNSGKLSRLEKSLEECEGIIHRGPCRRVLWKIIELWKEEKETTIYVLESKELTKTSHVSIEKAVELLSKCGFIYVITGAKPKTKSPRGKKLLYPTPLGLLMNIILGLLYPEERSIGESEVVYPLAWYYVENTLFQRLPDIYEYTVQASRKGEISIEREKLLKGYLTTLHAMNILFLKAVEVEEKIGLSMRPSYSSGDLLESIRENIIEDTKSLERIKRGVEEGSVHYKLLGYLYEEYDRIAGALGVHGQGGSSTRINT